MRLPPSNQGLGEVDPFGTGLVYRQIGDGHVDAAGDSRLDEVVNGVEFDVTEPLAEF